MEAAEFDATLGGTEQLPFSANSLKFAASRSIEIAAMTESIQRTNHNKLIFQNLPVHMRRRVMSHNSKRLPIKLREAHTKQFKNNGFAVKQKRPSRKYRRRPQNLLDEYNRRQKRHKWLETHIWHAKRFHMIEKWGYRLAYAPCDKAFRACYRATSAHCLLQDISYVTPIEINGPVDTIKELFSSITSPSCGLGLCAKAYIDGKREGMIHLYQSNTYPFGYIGKLNFIWVPHKSKKTLWLFVHPSQTQQIESILTNLIYSNKNYGPEITKKRRKSGGMDESVTIKIKAGIFNRFRLTGPNSHAVLTHSLKCVESAKIKNDDWAKSYDDLNLEEKDEYWESLSTLNSPSQLPPKIIIGLIVKDPRLSRPSKRTKAIIETDTSFDSNIVLNIPSYASSSPLWDLNIHEKLKKKIMSNAEFIQHLTKTKIVPGDINENDPVLQSIPIILIQRPGSQDSDYKKIGYGSGWDIIVPAGYGLPFWLTFIMFGGRSGGLRETENLAFEMGECYFPPDSAAGKLEEKRIENELKEKYFRLPPSKRVNYIKLGINSPFICPWDLLLKDWCEEHIHDFFVLRDRQLLNQIQDSIDRKKLMPEIENSNSCLIPVYLTLKSRGNLKRHALICLPEVTDASNIKTLFEPHHEDPNEKHRKQKRKEHLKELKKFRKNRIKLKKQGHASNVTKRTNEPSEYVRNMRQLWLPSKIDSVRFIGTRQVLGYLSMGALSFSEARSCGIGYVAYNALSELLKMGQNRVLVRNVSSRKYWLANIQTVKNV
ncbi:ribonucleases P/MRP protein subunit POP1 [Bombyx mori]|uniref:Uncharacterized protein n=1 Tax=Bombyx mori TaxID=7091 RepID=A0A8R2AKW4_BOMMO|nr:ribonucleases P/MRP protein subunit POP1 [Bombyx mori]